MLRSGQLVLTLLLIALSTVYASVPIDTAEPAFKEQQVYLSNGANKHIYCTLCTRIIEEAYTRSHKKNVKKITNNVVNQLIDNQFKQMFIDEYSIGEIGSLQIGRRYLRKLVRPTWIVPLHLLPKGGSMPILWQNEVRATYDVLMNEYRNDIAEYLTVHYNDTLNSTLQNVCNSVVQACPNGYEYPAKDLAPVGDEQQIKPGEVLELPDLPDDAGYEDDDEL